MRALLFSAVLVAGCVIDPAQPVEPRPTGPSCTPGEVRECGCLAATGSQTCVAQNGVWSACGCTTAVGSDVVVPPAPPAVSQCGVTACAAFTEEDSEVGAKGCCTSSGACGSSSKFLFGTQCLPRGADPGKPNAACPAESGNFIDLEGCCRSDGFCGLTIDAVTNFDLGCIERTQMQKWVNDGSDDRDSLSRVFFLQVKDVSWPAIRCTP